MYPKKSKTKMQQHVQELNVNDVLLGRGTGPNDHPGNIHFRALVKDAHEEYMDAKVRGQKTRIARRVIASIRTKFKGRFLRKLTADETRAKTLREGKGEGDSPAAATAPADVFAVVTDDHTLVQKTKQAFRHLIRQNNGSTGNLVAGPAGLTNIPSTPTRSASLVSNTGSNGSLAPNHRVTPEKMMYEQRYAYDQHMHAASPRHSLAHGEYLHPQHAQQTHQRRHSFLRPQQHQQHHQHGNHHSAPQPSAVRGNVSLGAHLDLASRWNNQPATSSTMDLPSSLSKFHPRTSFSAAPAGAAPGIPPPAGPRASNNGNGLSLVQSLVAAQRDLNDARRLQQDAYLLKLIADKESSRSQFGEQWHPSNNAGGATNAIRGSSSSANSNHNNGMPNGSGPNAGHANGTSYPVPAYNSIHSREGRRSSVSSALSVSTHPSLGAATSASDGKPQEAPKMSDIIQAALTLTGPIPSSRRSIVSNTSAGSASANGAGNARQNGHATAGASHPYQPSAASRGVLLELLEAENTLRGLM